MSLHLIPKFTDDGATGGGHQYWQLKRRNMVIIRVRVQRTVRPGMYWKLGQTGMNQFATNSNLPSNNSYLLYGSLARYSPERSPLLSLIVLSISPSRSSTAGSNPLGFAFENALSLLMFQFSNISINSFRSTAFP